MCKLVKFIFPLLFSQAFADGSWNSYQPFQDGQGGYVARTSGLPIPVFRALSNGSITPTIGTAGTFARASSALMPTNNALTLKASGAECAEAFPVTLSTTRGGIYVTGAIKNYLLRSQEFDSATWVKNGTATVTANAVNGPAGGATADDLDGLLAGDGVQQDSGTAAGSNTFMCGVWMRADSGSRAVDLIIKDQAGTPATSTLAATVTTSWQQFRIAKTFSAATGNVVCEINVKDNTLFEIYADEAGLYAIAGGGADSLCNNYDLFPSITTAAAVASKVLDNLKYAGTEVTASRSQISVAIWFYLPAHTAASFGNNSPHIFNNFTDAWGCMQGARLNPNGTWRVMTCYGDDVYTATTTAPNAGAWNHLIVAVNYSTASHYTMLNGTSIHTSTQAVTARATTALVIGNISTSPTNITNFNSIIGRVELYADKLQTADATAIYNAQKGDYGL